MLAYIHILSYYKLFLYFSLFLEQLVVRKDMGVNEHERLTSISLRNKLK
jgi:uncharacterized membrane protein